MIWVVLCLSKTITPYNLEYVTSLRNVEFTKIIKVERQILHVYIKYAYLDTCTSYEISIGISVIGSKITYLLFLYKTFYTNHGKLGKWSLDKSACCVNLKTLVSIPRTHDHKYFCGHSTRVDRDRRITGTFWLPVQLQVQLGTISLGNVVQYDGTRHLLSSASLHASIHRYAQQHTYATQKKKSV